MTRIINGVVVEDGEKKSRAINIKGGNYFENINGEFVDGKLVSTSVDNPNLAQPQDLSEAGELAIDVSVTKN